MRSDSNWWKLEIWLQLVTAVDHNGFITWKIIVTKITLKQMRRVANHSNFVSINSKTFVAGLGNGMLIWCYEIMFERRKNTARGPEVGTTLLKNQKEFKNWKKIHNWFVSQVVYELFKTPHFILQTLKSINVIFHLFVYTSILFILSHSNKIFNISHFSLKAHVFTQYDHILSNYVSHFGSFKER